MTEHKPINESEPQVCNGYCRGPSVCLLVYRGHESPWCGDFGCSVWITSGINFRLLPDVPWEDID